MSNQDGRTFLASLTGRLVAVILLLACCAGILAGYSASTYSLNVFADGQVIPVKTSSRDPAAIVSQCNIAVGEFDKVDTTAFKVGAEAEDGNAIIVFRAVPVTFYDKGKKLKSIKAAGTIADALEAANIKLEGADTTELEPETLLRENMKINILRGFKVQVQVDGTKQKAEYAKGTVREFLDRIGVELGEYDVVKPGLTKTLKPGSKVIIKRVSYERHEVEKVIKFGTVTKTSSVLAEGIEKVARKGRNGTKTVVYEDKIVDGKVVSTKKVGETVHVKAVDKVVVLGSRGTAKTSSFNPGTKPTSYIKTFHGSATAYSGGGTTASGAPARRGLVAVNPRQIPYGSRLYIVADDGTVYGNCIAADTGGFVTNGSGTLVDLYMDTDAQARQWGRRNVTIYVISWGNGKV